MTTFIHDPDATLDYQVDWTDWLEAGDTISTSTWEDVPSDLTVGTDDQEPTNTTSTATVWISGGVAGNTYRLTNRITTAAGRVEDRTITLICRQK